MATYVKVMNIVRNKTVLSKLNMTKEDVMALFNISTIAVGIGGAEDVPDADCGCDVSLVRQYKKYCHGYFSILVCVLGAVANIFNVIVLTRKQMGTTPINRILTWLAVADILVMLEYIPFAYYYHVALPEKLDFPYAGAVYMLFHTHFCQVLHTISICLTLTLAIWRYLTLGCSQRNHIICSEKRCTFAITLSYVLPLIVCSPTFFMFTIVDKTITEDGQRFVLYHTDFSELANDPIFHTASFWAYAVLIKLLPCCILTLISCSLIRTLFTAKKRKQDLKNHDVSPALLNDTGIKKATMAEKKMDMTNRMLVAVLVLFLVTELPQGIFALRIGMMDRCFFLQCYQSFGEVMDILALLNGSISFILYCCMNKKFRTTFKQLFKLKLLSKRNTLPSDTHTTCA